jgi:hypothetical protein
MLKMLLYFALSHDCGDVREMICIESNVLIEHFFGIPDE